MDQRKGRVKASLGLGSGWGRLGGSGLAHVRVVVDVETITNQKWMTQGRAWGWLLINFSSKPHNGWTILLRSSISKEWKFHFEI